MIDNLKDNFYPEIKEYGTLEKLLVAELKRTGSPLCDRVKPFGSSAYWAYISENRRNSDISVALDERRFLAPFWNRGVQLASLKTASITNLTGALHAWFINQCTVIELKSAFPEVRAAQEASFYEKGPQAYVDFQWMQLCKQAMVSIPRLYPVVLHAYYIPVLRKLLPFNSMDNLCFSRCTGYPFTSDCPMIKPIDDNIFRVITPGRAVIGEGDVKTALDTAIRYLPPNCGTAIHGTADDLK